MDRLEELKAKGYPKLNSAERAEYKALMSGEATPTPKEESAPAPAIEAAPKESVKDESISIPKSEWEAMKAFMEESKERTEHLERAAIKHRMQATEKKREMGRTIEVSFYCPDNTEPTEENMIMSWGNLLERDVPGKVVDKDLTCDLHLYGDGEESKIVNINYVRIYDITKKVTCEVNLKSPKMLFNIDEKTGAPSSWKQVAFEWNGKEYTIDPRFINL